MEHSSISQRRQILIVSMILLGAFIAVLNQTILTSVLPDIMQDFNLSSTTAQWLTTIFMLISGILIPVSAFLLNKFTIRQLFFTAMTCLVVGSLISFLSFNFTSLLIGRIIQALGAGILLPLSQTVLFLLFSVEKRGVAMGVFGLVIGFAPAIAPVLSGYIVNIMTWKVLFLIILAISLLDFVISLFFMENVSEVNPMRLDIFSVVLSTLGFGGILFSVSIAGEIGWLHPISIGSIIVFALILTAFILRQLKLAQPVLEFRVYKYVNFTISTVLIVFMIVIFMGSMSILPLYLESIHDKTAFGVGLVLLPGGILLGILSPVGGRIYDILGPKLLSICSMIFIFIGGLVLAFTTISTSIPQIIIGFSLISVGSAGIMTPMTTAAINALPPHLITHGTAMNNTIRQVASAIGTALLITLMSTVSKASTHGHLLAMISGFKAVYIAVSFIALLGIILSFFIEQNKYTEGE